MKNIKKDCLKAVFLFYEKNSENTEKYIKIPIKC